MIDIQILRNANAISSTVSQEFFSVNAERQILVPSFLVPPFPFRAHKRFVHFGHYGQRLSAKE